ncbi:alpha/beta hydrolase, partial [Ligilactobacillus ruminis]
HSYEVTDRLNEISVPTLITSGTDDLCTPLVAKTMYDRIENARWELFAGCRHMSFVQENEKYVELLCKWLNEND